MQVEKFEDMDDFFSLFEGDTFDRQEDLGVIWLGYVDDNVVAGYDYESKIGWTSL